MQFKEELARLLPSDIPHRERLIEKADQHLELVAEANQYMNLTRIANPTEAAVKHVLDSVLPWKLFQGARQVLDAGTGAGFPGIPLSIVLPEVKFVLAESIQKKARFVEAACELLDLPNVDVSPERAETLALARRPDVVMARAVAPLHRLLDLFATALRQGSRLLLYKGPDVETELAEINGKPVLAEIVFRYELPDDFGTRTMLSVSAAHHKRGAANRR